MPDTTVAPLLAGPIDVIGDVHGELLALRQLLRHLGYNEHGEHPDHARPALAACRGATGREREDIRRFFGSLPLALERSDLRITHAAWHVDSVRALQQQPQAGTLDQYCRYEAALPGLIPRELSLAADQEKRHWGALLEDPAAQVP